MPLQLPSLLSQHHNLRSNNNSNTQTFIAKLEIQEREQRVEALNGCVSRWYSLEPTWDCAAKYLQRVPSSPPSSPLTTLFSHNSSRLSTTAKHQQWPQRQESLNHNSVTWFSLSSYSAIINQCYAIPLTVQVNSTRVHCLYVMFAAVNAYVHYSASQTLSGMLKALINCPFRPHTLN